LRVLLARLALDPGRPVSVDALSEALWGADPPADQANALQSLVSRLRRRLPGDVLVSGPGTYRLDLPAEAVDAIRFERRVRDGQAALKNGDPAGASRCLREALALWRGPALAELPGTAHASWLEELRLTAHEDCAEAELVLGRAADLVPELRRLAAGQPMRERLTGLLVRALHAASLLGVADGLRGGPDYVNVDGRVLAERLRAELGGDRFAEAFEHGRNLPRDGQLALAVPESVRSGAAAVGPHGEGREDGNHPG
jgi:hypothetical protein